MRDYIKNILISFDQFAGSFIPNSYPDETISSRAFRENWRVQKYINYMFKDPMHCEDAYWSEINRKHNFRSYQ